jgi:flagellar biosynthetic protein FlhB
MAGSDKSEQPTHRRLLKAREQGNFASARQFISGAQFLAFVVLLRLFGEKWLTNMGLTMAYLLRRAFSRDLAVNDYVVLLRDLAWYSGGPILLVGFGLMLFSLGLQMGLTQMGLSVQKLMPDFKRLSPANKLKQFTRQNFPAAAQALILLPLAAYAV